MPDAAEQINRDVSVAPGPASNHEREAAALASRTIVVPLSLRARVAPRSLPEQPARLKSGPARRR